MDTATSTDTTDTGSGGDSSGSGGSDTTSGGDSSGSGGSDSSSGGQGSDGDDPQLGDEDYQVASITMYRRLASRGTSGSSSGIGIFFARDPSVDQIEPVDRNCVRESFGDCGVTQCDAYTDPGGAIPVRLEAGKMTFLADGAIIAETEFYDESTTYLANLMAGFAGGEVISLTAEGGVVSAFNGQINMPLAPLLLAPAAAEGAAMAVEDVLVSRTQDLDISWDARDSAEYILVDLEYDSSLNTVSMSCFFDAEQGEGTVPAGALDRLAPGSVLHTSALNGEKVMVDEGYIELVTRIDILSENKVSYPRFVLQ